MFRSTPRCRWAARLLLAVGLALAAVMRLGVGPLPVQGSPAVTPPPHQADPATAGPAVGDWRAQAPPVTPATPSVTVVVAGPPVSKQGLRVQWQPLQGAFTVTVVRNGRASNDPLFKSSGLLPGGQTAYLDEEAQPGQQYEYEVCVAYAGPVYKCSDWVGGMLPGGAGSGAAGIVVDAYTSYQTAIDISWSTVPSRYYNDFKIRYRAKPLPGGPDTGYGYIDHDDDGEKGSHQIKNLDTNTTYLISVQGFHASDSTWSDYGPEFQATTLPPSDMADRPKPQIIAGETGDSWVFVAWSVDYGPKAAGKGKYAMFVVSYQEKPKPNQPIPPMMKEIEDGLVTNHTIYNLKAGTTYLIYVQGCNYNLGTIDPGQGAAVQRNGPPGVDCALPGPTAEETTKTAAVGSFFAPAQLAVSPPSITAGNPVTVNGSVFHATGNAKLTLVGPKGSVDLGHAAINQTPPAKPGDPEQGSFSASVTIPANTAPGAYKIVAQSTGEQAEASLEVLAPSKKGTLTASEGRGAETALDLDYPITLSGSNFTPGPVSLFIDSPSGPPIGTATVAANGTFQVDVKVKSALGAKVIGKHDIVAVQNGAVVATLSVTFVPPEQIH